MTVWTIQQAKARLSEILRLARSGAPQRIGLGPDACVLVSGQEWEARAPRRLGAWLVESAPRGEDLEIPSRASHRGDPFA